MFAWVLNTPWFHLKTLQTFYFFKLFSLLLIHQTYCWTFKVNESRCRRCGVTPNFPKTKSSCLSFSEAVNAITIDNDIWKRNEINEVKNKLNKWSESPYSQWDWDKILSKKGLNMLYPFGKRTFQGIRKTMLLRLKMSLSVVTGLRCRGSLLQI